MIARRLARIVSHMGRMIAKRTEQSPPTSRRCGQCWRWGAPWRCRWHRGRECLGLTCWGRCRRATAIFNSELIWSKTKRPQKTQEDWLTIPPLKSRIFFEGMGHVDCDEDMWGGLCWKNLIDCHHPPEGAIKLPLPWGQIRFGVLYVGEWGTWGKEGL